jgi:hypothetical protein
MANHLEALATRLEDDAFFLACTLKHFASSEGLDKQGLAAALECSKETLILLQLCRTPDAAQFKKDLEQIASRFQVNRNALLQAIRRGQAILNLRQINAGGKGMLLAARDGDDEKVDEKPRGDGS